MLARRGAVVEVFMVTNGRPWEDPASREALDQDRKNIAARVFPGQTVELHLCDDTFEVLYVVRP